jgi:catechol 2,3-dioxygenase-like lactoylglutathione lyase family enzyme
MTLSGLLVGVTLALFTMTGAKMTASAGDAGPMPPDRAKIEAETAAHRAAFRIKSIDHTGFTVSSLDDSLKFWVDVLGFKHLYTWTFDRGPFIEQLVGVPGAGMRLAMVEGPGHMIELLEYTSPDDRQIFKPRSSDVGSVHLAFYVVNIDALLARLASVGWLTVGEVQTVESGERRGLRLIYVRGPDGITLEFLQRPEDAQK